MTETWITFDNAMLLSAICLSSGIIIGAAMWAYKEEVFSTAPEPKVDFDALQAELDRDFGPITTEQAARMTP